MSQTSPLNGLTASEWIKHSISYLKFSLSEPQWERKTEHPATFPLSLATHFIEFFSKTGETVLDPFCGSGTTLIAAALLGRLPVGIELYDKWIGVAREIIEKHYYNKTQTGLEAYCTDPLPPKRVTFDQLNIAQGDAIERLGQMSPASVDYALFSPPYANALSLSSGGVITRQKQRKAAGRSVTYGEHPGDIGNIDVVEWKDYIVDLFIALRRVITPGRYITCVIQNIVTKNGVIPLAFEVDALATSVGWTLKLDQIWIQSTKPGRIHGWPSNPMQSNHHVYCLTFCSSE